MKKLKRSKTEGQYGGRFDEFHISSVSLAYFSLKKLLTSHEKLPDHVANMAKHRVRGRVRVRGLGMGEHPLL